MADNDNIDWEAEGLVTYAYDSFFKIDKRIHKIQDLYLPTRAGLSVNQIGTFVIVFIVSAVVFALITAPLMGLLHIPRHWMVTVAMIFGPPVLASWRVTKPMPHGKTIPGTVQSITRYLLDDPTHRRGTPVPTAKVPPDVFVQHYQRDWRINREFAAEVPGEGEWTDPETERRRARYEGVTVNLQEWMDAKAIAHWEQHSEAKGESRKVAITPSNPRGRAATVREF